jgi:5,10-methylenetetrahydromethanopterin reductase
VSGGGRELGLGLLTDKRPGEYAALARIAEKGGFDVVAVFNDLWYQASLPPLLEIAGATESIRLGPSCLNPSTIHPVEIGAQIAALDLASGGRAFLGLCAGAWLDELGIEPRRPVERVAEAWEVVSRLLAGDRSGFEGELFWLAPGRSLASPPLRSRVPLLVGTWSPRMTAFARDRADELKLGGTANPALVSLTRERLGGGVGLVVGATTVVDADGAVARAHARARVAPYVAVVAGLDPTLEVEPGLLSALAARLGNGDEAGAAALVSDELLDRFAFAGTPSQVAAQAEALFAAGAARIEFGGPHGLEERDGVELLVREVAPLLRG